MIRRWAEDIISVSSHSDKTDRNTVVCTWQSVLDVKCNSRKYGKWQRQTDDEEGKQLKELIRVEAKIMQNAQTDKKIPNFNQIFHIGAINNKC